MTGYTFNDTDRDRNYEETVVSFATAPPYYTWQAILRNLGV